MVLKIQAMLLWRMFQLQTKRTPPKDQTIKMSSMGQIREKIKSRMVSTFIDTA
jgi:hypothetical protein